MVKFSNEWMSEWNPHESLSNDFHTCCADHDHACREWHDMLQVTVDKDVNSYSIAYTFTWLVPSKDRT